MKLSDRPAPAGPTSRYSGNVSKSHTMPAISVAGSMSSTFSSVRTIDVVVLGTRRRDREAAVAGDDGGDAVVRRRPQRRIPEHLRVVVRVDVDEAGRDRAARRVELALAAAGSAPISAITPSAIATSATRPGAPLPSKTVPPRMTMSAGMSGSSLSRIDHELEQVPVGVAHVHARRVEPATALARHRAFFDLGARAASSRACSASGVPSHTKQRSPHGGPRVRRAQREALRAARSSGRWKLIIWSPT